MTVFDSFAMIDIAAVMPGHRPMMVGRTRVRAAMDQAACDEGVKLFSVLTLTAGGRAAAVLGSDVAR